jgi:hypothetical protein
MKVQIPARNLLIGFLALVVVASGWPGCFAPDRNRNAEIDLQDVILSVQALARSADRTDGFLAGMADTLTAMKILSGLKSVVKTSPAGVSNGTSWFDHTYLISTQGQSFDETGSYGPVEQRQILCSADLEPEPPPPKA